LKPWPEQHDARVGGGPVHDEEVFGCPRVDAGLHPQKRPVRGRHERHEAAPDLDLVGRVAILP